MRTHSSRRRVFFCYAQTAYWYWLPLPSSPVVQICHLAYDLNGGGEQNADEMGIGEISVEWNFKVIQLAFIPCSSLVVLITIDVLVDFNYTAIEINDRLFFGCRQRRFMKLQIGPLFKNQVTRHAALVNCSSRRNAVNLQQQRFYTPLITRTKLRTSAIF